MASINKHQIRRRVSGVYDTAHGAQATSRSIKQYARSLERSVDIHRESMGSAEDFLRDWNHGRGR